MDTLAELAGAHAAAVADALDGLGLRDQALDPAIRPLFPRARLVGRAMPILVTATSEIPSEPYDGEMRALDALSQGTVPVFAVDPQTRAAAWGELFSCGALGKGAIGAIVDGFVRDADQIEELGYPVFCRGCSPLDTLGRAAVTSFGEEVVCGGVLIRCGDFMIADTDGVVAIPEAAAGDVMHEIRSKSHLERGARTDLLAGASVRDVWSKYGVF